MNIGNRISEFRRKKGATQEQLANYVGVTVAAVSKWETDNSYPDITLVPAIAEYLGVSIDALMDFDLSDGNVELLRDRNNKYLKSGDYNAGIPLYEKAIKKLPNDCFINHNYAELLLAKAFSKSAPDVELARKAVYYFEKSLQLDSGSILDVNSTRQGIAFIYGGIGEYEKAIAYLEQISEKTNETQIADYQIKMGNYGEAKRRLQQELYDFAVNFCYLTDTLMKCFEHDGDRSTVFKLTKLNAEFREYFADSETANYFDDLSTYDFSRLANAYKEKGDYKNMWRSLSKAVAHAVRFDANPSYNPADVNFMDGFNGNITNSSSTNACLPLIRYIESTFSEFSDEPQYVDLIEKLNRAKSDKKQKGIWE